MLHSASSGAYGNKKELEEKLAFLDSIDTNLATMISAKLGKEVQEIKDTYFDGNDHWLSANECKGDGDLRDMGAYNGGQGKAAEGDCVPTTHEY